MNLMISSQTYQLPLKHPFSISRYTVHVQETVIVSISNGEFTGYGEATVNPFYNSTADKVNAALASVRALIENSFGLHPKALWNLIEPKLKHDYFALCAVDCAYWDFYSKLNKKTLRSFWSKKESKVPKTNYTIGIDSIDKMKVKIIDKPWPIYKIKLGTSNDLEIIDALRRVTNAVFRIDANCAWNVKETLKNAVELKSLGVEFIEQPLEVKDWDAMKILKDKSELPIFADESCQKLTDVEKCAEGFHGINIKLMKCGGITPALKMIELAKKYNLKVMAGCMTESTIGISNLVQLAQLLDFLDADGAMLLEKDIAKGVTFQDGNIIFSESYGSGAKLL